MMWFDFVRWRFHFIRRLWNNQIDVIQNCISSETYNWYMYTIRDMVSHIYGFHRCLPNEKWEVERFLLVLVLIGFLWNNLWSVSRYIMGSFSGWWRLGGDDLRYLAAPIWKCRSGFGDHRFIFFIDLFPNYTFYTNLTNIVHWVVVWRKCGTPDSDKFREKLKNVCKIVWCRFNIVYIKHIHWYKNIYAMMTSSNGNIFRVTGPLCGEFTGHRWIPRTNASDAELWCFLWYAPEQTVE